MMKRILIFCTIIGVILTGCHNNERKTANTFVENEHDYIAIRNVISELEEITPAKFWDSQAVKKVLFDENRRILTIELRGLHDDIVEEGNDGQHYFLKEFVVDMISFYDFIDSGGESQPEGDPKLYYTMGKLFTEVAKAKGISLFFDMGNRSFSQFDTFTFNSEETDYILNHWKEIINQYVKEKEALTIEVDDDDEVVEVCDVDTLACDTVAADTI